MKHLNVVARAAGLLAGLLATGSDGFAQKPVASGTASTMGGAAVTEARRADAILWNPALVGIWDGPQSSYSFLSFDVASIPSEGWLDRAGAMGLLGGASPLHRVDVLRRVLPGADARPGTMAGVTWGAFQARDLALSVSSHVSSEVEIPEDLARELSGAESEDAAPRARLGDLEPTTRSLSTMVSLAKAAYLGSLSVVGPVWIGATGKGWVLHSHAAGRFLAPGLGTDVYDEVQIDNVVGYGVDVGFALRPIAGVRLGGSLSNAYSAVVRPKEAPRLRTVSAVRGTGGDVEVSSAWHGRVDAGDRGTPLFDRVEAFWSDAAYPAMLRLGGALDTPWGTFAGAYQEELRSGGLEPSWGVDRYTAAFRGGRLRVMTGWGAGQRQYGIGLSGQACERMWTIGVGRRSDEHGSAFSVNGSLAITDLACQTPR